MAGIITGTVVGASGCTLLARILGNAGLPLVQADLTSIAYTVRDLFNATTVASGTFSVSGSVFNALQTDGRWTVDNSSAPGPDGRFGYNFAATIPAASLANLFTVNTDNSVIVHKTQVSVLFTPVTGQPFVQVFQFQPLPTW